MDDIIQGFADAYFISNWADAVERYEEEHDTDLGLIGARTQIEHVAPPTPAFMVEWAKSQLAHISTHNNVELPTVFWLNCIQEGHRRTPKEHDFGWYIAMQQMGHGVCWSDDHPDHKLDVGYGSVNIYLDEDSPFTKMYIDAEDLHEIYEVKEG